MSGGSRVDRTRAGASLPALNVGMEMRENTAREEFHRQYDISYVAPGLPKLPLPQAVKHYFASAAVYGVVLLFYTINPWFRSLLTTSRVHGVSVLTGYYYAFALYLVVSPLVLLLLRPRSVWVSKNLLVLGYFQQLVQWLTASASEKARRSWRPSYAQKHALMFLLLKTIYGPLMIANVVNYGGGLAGVWAGIGKLRMVHGAPLVFWCDLGFDFLFYAVFILDPLVSALAYHFESSWLGNKLRCTDTNPFHVFVCLACYQPFNLMTAAVLGPSYHTHMILWNNDLTHPVTWVLRGAIAVALLFMLSASLSLCTRATNLTNRGIVDWGPYRLIRHPGYLSKNIYWLLTLIPFFVPNPADPAFTWPAYAVYCAALVGGYLGWASLYFCRALTEEQFLMQDPDYVAYCKKVRYRFIPGVY